MSVQYNKFCKLLTEIKIKKLTLTERAGVLVSIISKFSQYIYITLEVLERICRVLRFKMGDVSEFAGEVGKR